MTSKFIILRKDGDDFQTMGPVAAPMTLEQASEEAAALAARFPHLQFHVFADVGSAVRKEVISLELETPDVVRAPLPGVTPIRRRAKAA